MNEAKLELVKKYKEFEYPGHRFRSKSTCSGEEFRDDILIPFIDAHKDEEIVLDLAGAIAYPPSFLEEAFGGAIRKGYDRVEQIKIIGVDETVKDRIARFIKAAKAVEPVK